jgi:hypothetical protein
MNKRECFPGLFDDCGNTASFSDVADGLILYFGCGFVRFLDFECKE